MGSNTVSGATGRDLRLRTYHIEFTPSGHSAWVPFIERTADIEIAFAIAPPLMIKVLQAIRTGDQNTIEICLRKFPSLLETMKKPMLRLLTGLMVDLRKGSSTREFQMTNSLDKKRTAIRMEGASTWVPVLLSRLLCRRWMHFLASSMHQVGDKSLRSPKSYGTRIYALQTNAFSICHALPLEIHKFLVCMRAYMIRPHRHFIEDLERHSTLRDYGKFISNMTISKTIT
uniref:Uncharacterized protein n=1 Tax=Schistocephalus solidus TaxID=70667 RepID=A0A0X3P6G7_SCHSO